ncbi:MAG: nuclear transport factor 2 family protein [Methylobacterium sp.]|jgi:hypothetical protein|uniref:nuclear transport factor 2 family protein n=1 Tax=Rhabdaerophilum sp. TaxID=2717341 RepID=UPI0022C0DC70|nr:nuclear transport factor 2 family protein [Cupriavidus sp.]MCA3663565.1 nuclear transport factor 2 family protein [Methylobacterium sp.]MCZ8272063.1 nuclear transport factor 2 family protein [Beijerinckiaceae bacterium]MCA3666098.1 nuclear transport factor 2 family protein [Methylobacterium sp.]MCA3682454.1 nuclear transport factor 2 family protein [Methylobacterium sp.]
MLNDIAALEALAATYLDGLHEGDAAKLGSVFLSTSALTQAVDGKVSITPCETWLERVAARPSPKRQGLERDDHVLAIDLVGPDLALLKIKCAIPPRYFTDLLSCLKVDGRWQVAQKVFMTETR